MNRFKGAESRMWLSLPHEETGVRYSRGLTAGRRPLPRLDLRPGGEATLRNGGTERWRVGVVGYGELGRVASAARTARQQ